MTSNFSTLEAVRDSPQPGLEVASKNYRDQNPTTHPPQPGLEVASKNYGDQNPATHLPPPRKLWGLTPKVFWIVFVIILVVVIGAAVGGGVGATRSHKSSSNSNLISTPTSSTVNLTPSTSAIVGVTPSHTPSLTPSLTTTPVIGPSATLLRDCPSSNGTLFTSSPNPTNPQSFLKFCSATIMRAPSVPQDVIIVNVPTTSLNDCIGLCATYNENNKTTIAAGADYVCNAVCWRNGFENDDHPGICFGFTTVNSTASGAGLGNFQLTVNDPRGGLCDSAGWIDQRKLT